MKRNSGSSIEFWKYVRTYLTIYLPRIRCLSLNTIESYRQSITMYCLFLKEQHNLRFSKISFENITRESVKDFIQWLRDRTCSASTCNIRLSSLKSLLKYCADEDIRLYSVYMEVKKIPLLKVSKMPVNYLSENALRALIEQPDKKTQKGLRNRMIIILLYDTGTRVQELVDISTSDLHLDLKNPFIQVNGKGNKTRSIPLMDKTVAHLKNYLCRFHNNTSNENTSRPLFYSIRSGIPHMLSTDTISVVLKNCARIARIKCQEVPIRVHPHLIRHTRAMHLYKAGMPLSYIAEFLGHANVNTTDIYASADIEMLRDALEKADNKLSDEPPHWKDEEILKKLCGL